MKKIRVYLMLALLTLVGACTDETFTANETPLSPPAELKYAETGEAREGKAIKSGMPSLNTFGTSPLFSIENGYMDGTELSEQLLTQFSIVDSTGIISTQAGNSLTAQAYQLDVTVETKGGKTTFPKGYSVKVLPALLEGLAYPMSTVSFERGKENTSGQPDFAGNQENVSFSLLETEGSTFFSIDEKTGVIAMTADATPEIGSYKLSLKGNNIADSVMTFNNALTVNVVSKPYKLVYEPKIQTNVQEFAARSSQEPTVTASNTADVTYTLADGTSEYFTIDEKSGAVSLKAMHSFKAGQTVYVSVIATNDYGAQLFEEAVGFEIVPQEPVPPTEFNYSAGNEGTVMETMAFASAVPYVEGAYPISFAIKAGNEAGQFSIDATTGQVTLPKGHTLAEGNYPLEIEATNAFGSAPLNYTVHVTTLMKSVIFDADFNKGGAVKNGATGNLVSVDLDNNGTGTAGYKMKWYGKYNAFYTKEGMKRSGVQMVPQKAENNDWLLAESIDLSNYESAELFLEFYMLYGGGHDDINRIKVKVSEDYKGDVNAATWTEVGVLNDLFDHKDKILGSYTKVTGDYVDQEVINLSAYNGKTITVAIHAYHSTSLNPAKEVKLLSRSTIISYFKIRGLEK
ncbi:DUF4958 domain-containing protein [Marinilabiliaceae bacterium JC017]|nr:DUF4958 domain-containing protein [Marinilabiliaceae bacterium JC017]